MSVKIHCDRCNAIENDPKTEFQQLDYVAKGIGKYHTIHLCNICKKIFEEFMKAVEE